MNIKSESTVWSSIDGEDVMLSIDSRIQNKLYENIKIFLKMLGLVAEPESSWILRTEKLLLLQIIRNLILKSYPKAPKKKKIKSFVNNPNKPFLDRVNAGLYTPGSIVKPFIAIGALNENIIKPETKILSTGQIEIQNPYDSTKNQFLRTGKHTDGLI